jgi:beta-galactosidase
MGWHDGIDHYELAADLDLASWDWYIGTGYHKYLDTGAIHDWVRGFKRRNFWLMETQPGHVNWSAANNSLRRGEARKMAWHAIGHGADAILYWQWRSALNGQEQYHGALLDQAGQPRPFYAEAQQLGAELAQVSAALAGTRVVSPVALLFDYPSRWSLGWQAHHKNFDYIEHLLTYYRPLAARNIPVDIVSQDAPLDDYAVVIAPALLMLKPETAARLLPLVKNKGLRLVLTARCGLKDEYNALLPLRQPGWLADLAGVEVEDYYVLLQPVPVTGLPVAAQASIWAERLKLRAGSRAEVLARYGAGDGWLDDQPAITVTDYAPGQVYYVGAQLDAAGMDAFFNRVLSQVPLPPGLPAPAGVEVCPRTAADGRNLLITINHEQFEQTVPLPWAAHDLLSGQTLSGALKLAPYGVAVLDRTRAR